MTQLAPEPEADGDAGAARAGIPALWKSSSFVNPADAEQAYRLG